MLLLILLLLIALEAFMPSHLAAATRLLASSNASLSWGPYRPNIYFGIRPRVPNSLLIGLMWSNADDSANVGQDLRHTCEQNDGMAGYGWTAYDVRNGGRQVVNDTKHRLDLIIDFAKPSEEQAPETWGVRIQGVPRRDAPKKQKSSVVLYLGGEERVSGFECKRGQSAVSPGEDITCHGIITGSYTFVITTSSRSTDKSSSSDMSVNSLTVSTDSLWKAKPLFIDKLKDKASKDGMVANSPGEGNLHFIQQKFEGPFEFDVLFSEESTPDVMTSASLTRAITTSASVFSEKFSRSYSPQSPFKGQQFTHFSQSLISNILGGIGFFYGTIKVDESNAETAATPLSNANVKERGPYQLYSATPSRPFFPRGFLWDEGFHLQIVLDWDADLALEIVSSWFELMDENGWIAREQILGLEAQSKVPPEFQTQYTQHANPPTLFLVVEAFLAKLKGESTYAGAPSRYVQDPASGKAYLKAMYPKLKKNYEWFRRTQSGDLTNYRSIDPNLDEGYRWRGRTPKLTLPSGLDDYPRPQPPHPEELHVDALCWVGSMAESLTRISAFLDEAQDSKVFEQHKHGVLRSIDAIHWSEKDKAYCDTTIKEGKQVERVCHKGYISLFPFLLGLMGPEHEHLGTMLDLLRDPEEIWSPYGLRSLSRRDPFYGTDENYWRSPIWVPINFLALNQLLRLATFQGNKPSLHQQKAQEMYAELRKNLVGTVFESWRKTGFVWEQYNPDSGQGQRTQHFTGWTALVAKIMAMPDLEQPREGGDGGRQQPQIPERSGSTRSAYGRGFSMTLLLVMFTGILVACYWLRRAMMRAVWRILR